MGIIPGMGTPGGGAPGIGTPNRDRERQSIGVRTQREECLIIKIYTSIKLLPKAFIDEVIVSAGYGIGRKIFVSPGGGGMPGGGMPGGGIPGGGGKFGGG